jgi:TrmH family RNA methyltransferase
VISSVANPTVRRVRRLRKSLWRERQGRFIVEGHRAVDAAVAAGAQVEDLFVTPKGERARTAVIERAHAAGLKTVTVAPAVMQHWTAVATAPDVLAVVKFAARTSLPDRPLNAVVLCGVHDPATAGAILATAAACGFRTAVIGPNSVDPYEAKVVRAAAGAHFALAIVRGLPLAAALDALRAAGARVVVASEKGVAPWDADLAGPVALVVDGDGTAEADGERVALPTDGPVPSLATRAAVVLYEWMRHNEAAS